MYRMPNQQSTGDTNAHEEKPLKRWQIFFIELAKMLQFLVRFFKEVWRPPYEFKEFLRQCYLIGYMSLPLIVFTAFISGIVFTRQSRPSLVSFGAESWLPSLVSIAFIRSLGPLITSLISAGKVGSNIGAELGSMRVTEQIDAMEVSGTNPFKYLVVTRVLACTIMLPILVVFADTFGLLGSFLDVNMYSETGFSLYLTNAFSSVSLLDISSTFVKPIFFGFTIGMIGCYKGYNAEKGTVGVGKAANEAVVLSMLLIFVLDILGLQILTVIRGL